jgi:hypothetical protein
MEFRLGEFECGCGNRERPGIKDPRQREFAPPQLTEMREAAAVATKTAYALPQAELKTLRSTRDYRKLVPEKDRYDPSPGLEIEKWVSLGFFTLRLAIGCALALSNGYAADHPSWLISAGLQLGLVFLTMFTPSAMLKVGFGYVFGLLGLLQVLVMLRQTRRVLLHGGVVPDWYGWAGYSGSMVMLLLLALSLLWVASVLFREAHRIQVRKAA